MKLWLVKPIISSLRYVEDFVIWFYIKKKLNILNNQTTVNNKKKVLTIATVKQSHSLIFVY